jgi:hypothetical protein
MRSQIDRAGMPESAFQIGFFELRVMRVAGALFLQMLSNHVGKRIEQEFERLSVVGFRVIVMLVKFVDDRLDVLDDTLGIYGIRKFEMLMFGLEVHLDVPLTKKPIEYGVALYFYAMDGMVVDIYDIAGEIFPIHVDDPAIRDNPDVVIPVENHVDDAEIDAHQIKLEIRSRHEIRYAEGVLKIEKKRQYDAEKAPQQDIVDDKYRMPVTDEEKLVTFLHVLREIQIVELVHTRSV